MGLPCFAYESSVSTSWQRLVSGYTPFDTRHLILHVTSGLLSERPRWFTTFISDILHIFFKCFLFFLLIWFLFENGSTTFLFFFSVPFWFPYCGSNMQFCHHHYSFLPHNPNAFKKIYFMWWHQFQVSLIDTVSFLSSSFSVSVCFHVSPSHSHFSFDSCVSCTQSPRVNNSWMCISFKIKLKL